MKKVYVLLHFYNSMWGLRDPRNRDQFQDKVEVFQSIGAVRDWISKRLRSKESCTESYTQSEGRRVYIFETSTHHTFRVYVREPGDIQ